MNEGQEVSAVDIGLAERAGPPTRPKAQDSQLVVAPRRARRQSKRMVRLAAQLGLSGFLHSQEALRAELQKIIFALHPDKTGGEFRSEAGKARFMQARALVELLDGQGLDLEAADPTRLPRSARALGDGRNIRRNAAAQVRLQMRVLAEARRNIASHFAVPKIVSGAIAAAFAVTLLTQDAQNNPLLGSWLELPWVSAALWCLTGLSALALVVLWWVGHSAGRRAEHLMSEAALRPIFDQALSCAGQHGRAGKLTAWDVRRAIEMLVDGRSERAGPLAGWKFLGALDFTTLERIAGIQMQRLIDRRVLRELNTPSIEILYEVSPLTWQT